ncbi:Hypothetical protein POVR1_LOCUS601 [uncultured virus]|nr:Hypothetical protein POVR1_LOCUS601 [uncultured virus]
MKEGNIKSLWVGNVRRKNASLKTPGYGYFTPFINERGEKEYPRVNAVTVDSRESFDIIYVHINNRLIRGIYALNTNDSVQTWYPVLATHGSLINASVRDTQIDADERTVITSMYCRDRIIYLVTPTAIYTLDGYILNKVSKTGCLARDHYGTTSVTIENDGTIKSGKISLPLTDHLRVAKASNIKCLDTDRYVVMIEKNGVNHLGYGSIPNREMRIDEKCVAFDATIGRVTYMNEFGKIKLMTSDNAKEYIHTVDVKANTVMAVSNHSVYVFSTK